MHNFRFYPRLITQLIVIVIFILDIYFAIIVLLPNIGEKYKKLWEPNFPEVIKVNGILAENEQLGPKATSFKNLKTQANNNRGFGSDGLQLDTENISLKRYVHQVKAFFQKSMVSVNNGKEINGENVARVRQKIGEKIIGFFGAPQASIVMGLVFGDDARISSLLSHQLKIIGMQHIISASGYNVSLLLSIVAPIFSRFWRPRMACLFFLAGIWAYVCLAGASASLWRAGLMASLSLVLNRWCHLQTKPSQLLFLSFCFLLLFQPELAKSISFQLSAGATLGLITLAAWLNEKTGLVMAWIGLEFGTRQLKAQEVSLIKTLIKSLQENFLTTLAAQAFTAPLVWYHFQEFSLVSFISNPTLLWLVPLITISGVVAVPIVLISSYVPILNEINQTWLAWIVWLECDVLSRGIAFWSQFEFGFLELPAISGWLVAGWWVAGLVLSWQLSQRHYRHQQQHLRKLYEF